MLSMEASDCPYTRLPRLRKLLLGDHVPAATPGQVGSVVYLPAGDTMENQVRGGSVRTGGTLLGTQGAGSIDSDLQMGN